MGGIVGPGPGFRMDGRRAPEADFGAAAIGLGGARRDFDSALSRQRRRPAAAPAGRGVTVRQSHGPTRTVAAQDSPGPSEFSCETYYDTTPTVSATRRRARAVPLPDRVRFPAAGRTGPGPPGWDRAWRPPP